MNRTTSPSVTPASRKRRATKVPQVLEPQAPIPARVTAAYALGLEPPDFHLVVEAYDGRGWRLLDPTGLASVATLVPIATGRDAAEVAWASAAGGVRLQELSVDVTATA